MSNKFEEKFLDYIEGILSEEEKRELEEALANDPGLKRSFEGYKEIVSTEKIIQKEKHNLSANFAVKVMDRLEEENRGFIRRYFMEMVVNSRSAARIFASLVVVLGVVHLYRTMPESSFRQIKTEPQTPAPASQPVLPKPLEDIAAYKRQNESLSITAMPPVAEAKEIYQDLNLKRSLGETFGQPSMSHVERMSVVEQEASGGANSYTNNEYYNSFEENTRHEVGKDPSSTFSIDVDTASYANTRRFLSAGTLPPKDSVRIEEFLNYFDYNYPKQYERPFSLSYEIAPSPLENDRYLLKLGIKAKDKKETSKPWNLVFLVDVSGSMMDTNKLPLVQRSLRLLTENMKEGDKVSIVTYAGSAGTALEPTTIKEKSKIISAIDSLSAGGSTNGSGGINAAYDLALRSKISDGVNRVVLTTDGDFNVGVTSKDELIKLIEEKRKSGITLTTLGFGIGNLKDGTMEQLANKGNGNYYYIDSFKEARKVLETDLAGTMEVVAKDVKLQIEFNPSHVQSYRLIGYENRKLKREDFNNDAIDAGEIGTGHTVTAMYEIVLKDSELAKKLNEEYRYQDKANEKTENEKAETKPNDFGAELAFLKIRYKEPESSNSELLSFPIEKANLKNKAEEASSDFRFAAAVSYFGHLLRDSQYKGTYTYTDIVKLAESGKAEDKNAYRQEFIGLVKDAASLQPH